MARAYMIGRQNKIMDFNRFSDWSSQINGSDWNSRNLSTWFCNAWIQNL